MRANKSARLLLSAILLFSLLSSSWAGSVLGDEAAGQPEGSAEILKTSGLQDVVSPSLGSLGALDISGVETVPAQNLGVTTLAETKPEAQQGAQSRFEPAAVTIQAQTSAQMPKARANRSEAIIGSDTPQKLEDKPGALGLAQEMVPQDAASQDRGGAQAAQKAEGVFDGEESDGPEVVSLYRFLHPRSYDIALDLTPLSETFTGKVTLKADLVKAADHIRLHSLDMAFTKATVNGRVIDVSKIVSDPNPEQESIVIPLGQKMRPGKVTIVLEYTGRVNKDLRGLYQTTAKDPASGKEDKGFITQFEATDFRRVVPGIDEPQAKAHFSLMVSAPADYKVLSNMPQVSRRPVSNGRQEVVFAKSPRMSSYLLAVSVAHMKSLRTKLGRIAISAWAASHDIHQARFALEHAKASLALLTRYFGIPYPLAKMDLLAVPDFAAGAMEHWGMITFADSAILFNPKLSSLGSKWGVAATVTHEQVHQWHGNLVTMVDFGGLWLNEAFAMHMEPKILNMLYPEWNMAVQRDRNMRQEALVTDSLKSSRSVQAPSASTRDEIDALFDGITYDKGGSIVNMIENYVGEETFRLGVQAYLRAHKYGNVTNDDLWRTLSRISGKPVNQVTKGWIFNPGYPMIQVEPLSRDNKTIKVTQGRFFLDGSQPDDSLWSVPLVIKYKVKGENKPRLYRTRLNKRDMAIELPASGPIEWIYPNESATGFYRVALAPSLLKPLQAQALSVLGATERGSLLSDQAAMAKAGRIPVNDLLDMMTALKADESVETLEFIAGILTKFSEDFGLSAEDQKRLARAAQDMLGQHGQRLGWTKSPKDSLDAELSRRFVLRALGDVTHSPEIIKEAGSRLERHLKDPEFVDPALVSMILELGAQSGGTELFETYHDRFIHAVTPEQKDDLLEAMGKFNQPELVQRYFDILMSPDVRSQDVPAGLGAMLENPRTQAQAWNLIKAHWKQIAAKMGDSGVISLMGGYGIQSLTQDGMIQDVKNFFSEPQNDVGPAQTELDRSLELMEIEAHYRKTQGQGVSDWLKSRYP